MDTATIPATLVSTLTEREREILQWLAHGKRVGDIASIMDVSVPVLDQRIRIIKDKLGAATSSGAVAMALRCGAIK